MSPICKSINRFGVESMPLEFVDEIAVSSLKTTEIACGKAFGHCGELLQVWLRHGNNMKVVLNSLPCPVYSSAEVKLGGNTESWTITPVDREKALRSAIITSNLLGYRGGGTVTLGSNSRVGAGLGSSGTDCKATINAVFRACGHLPPQRDMLIALLQECGDSALDSTLLDSNCLTASRTFEVVQEFDEAFPCLICVAFDSAPDDFITTANTYLSPPESTKVRGEYQDLFDSFVSAVCEGDYRQIGAVSTACSRLGQHEVFNPALDSAIAICEAEQCLGLARSYTGTILTALFDPGDQSVIAKVRRVRSAFMHLTPALPFVFTTRPHGFV